MNIPRPVTLLCAALPLLGCVSVAHAAKPGPGATTPVFEQWRETEHRSSDDLLTAARPMFEVDLAGRVLPFDTEAALAYPEIAAGRKQGGKPISQIDAQIAAIVRSRGARLATRNVRDFAECGITIVDPWGEA